MLIKLTFIFHQETLNKVISTQSKVMTSSIHHSLNLYSASPLPDGSQIKEENKDAYPNIQFWNKEEWTAYWNCKKSKPTNPTADERVHAVSFIEDGNGDTMSATQLSAIHQTAWQIWETFKSCREATQQWGRANSKIVNMYRLKMCTTHPELQLCSNQKH